MNGRIVGLPVQAVVWTQNGQCAETPSRLSLALANAALISLALLKPLSAWSMIIGWLRAGRAGLFGVIRGIARDFWRRVARLRYWDGKQFGHVCIGVDVWFFRRVEAIMARGSEIN